MVKLKRDRSRRSGHLQSRNAQDFERRQIDPIAHYRTLVELALIGLLWQPKAGAAVLDSGERRAAIEAVQALARRYGIDA